VGFVKLNIIINIRGVIVINGMCIGENIVIFGAIATK